MLVFGLTICFLGKDTDDTTENRQTLVNIGTFFEPITSGSSRFSSLRPSQVNDIDVGHKLALRLSRFLIDETLLEDDPVNGVGTGRRSIHLGLPDRPVHVSNVELVVDLLVAGDGNVGDAIDVNACLWMLSDFQTFLGSFVGHNEQILHLFIVDLDHGDRDLALNNLLFIGLLQMTDALEDVFAGSWHDSFVLAISNDRVTLSRAGLTVGEKARIVPFKGVIEHFQSNF